jgi:hypothetical protein
LIGLFFIFFFACFLQEGGHDGLCGETSAGLEGSVGQPALNPSLRKKNTKVVVFHFGGKFFSWGKRRQMSLYRYIKPDLWGKNAGWDRRFVQVTNK